MNTLLLDTTPWIAALLATLVAGGAVLRNAVARAANARPVVIAPTNPAPTVAPAPVRRRRPRSSWGML